jgi:hypothetical protein
MSNAPSPLSYERSLGTYPTQRAAADAIMERAA